MDLIDSILKSDLKNISVGDYESLRQISYGERYQIESIIISLLSSYALNKEKNACKPNFEDLFLADIMTLLHSEIKELTEETDKDKKDYRRILEEIADCAAVLSGMSAHIMHEINKQKKEL